MFYIKPILFGRIAGCSLIILKERPVALHFRLFLKLIITERDIMAKTTCTVPITQIILDEEIYPRSGVYPKRVSMFVENIIDGFKIDPIEVQVHPEYGDKYRILDGAHRWHAYKEIGATGIPVHIITLDGVDPLLYAPKRQ